MKKIIIASKNPVKISAVENAFNKMLPNENYIFEGVSAASEVSDQPMTDEETLLGAMNRVKNIMKIYPDADYWVGLEGGIHEEDGEMTAFAWMYVVSHEKIIGKSKTATFVLPHPVAKLIREGNELGIADDIVFGRENSKQNSGSVGILTDDLIDRRIYYEHALCLALIPFKNKELYKAEMPKKSKIYFAASITGGRGDQKIYKEIVGLLKNYGELLTELFADKNLTAHGMIDKKPEDIYTTDINWIKDAEYIVAEVTTPSLGVGIELGKAGEWNKKVLCIYRPSQFIDRSLSNMIKGNSEYTTKHYETIEDLKIILDEFFQK